MVRVLVPGLVLFETRQDWTALPEWRDHDRTTCLCPIARENLEKIWEKNRTGGDYSVPLRKVLSSTELRDFSRKSTKNNTTQINIQFLSGECPKTVWSFFWLYFNYAIITVHFIKRLGLAPKQMIGNKQWFACMVNGLKVILTLSTTYYNTIY